MWFASIFSHSIARLFILLIGFHTEQKFLIFMKFNVLIVPFKDCAFGIKSKNFFT